MRINWKLLAGFSLFGAVVSLLSGIAAGNPFGIILLRLFLSAIVFGGLGLVVQTILRRYLPDLWLGSTSAKPGSADTRGGGAVDIIIDDELSTPLPGEELEAQEPFERSEPSESVVAAEREEPAEMYEVEETGSDLQPEAEDGFEDVEFGNFDSGAAQAGAGASRFSGPEGRRGLASGLGGESSAAEARQGADRGGVPELDILPDIDEADDQAGSGADLDSESPGLGGADQSLRRTPTTPREMRKAQIEETVKDQDPENLARAVRTFLKKDQ